ncbi:MULTISPECIES: hypothetical protein [Prauserella salsuginis group]|uniref:Uncharacterized protein n=1 Tax=Prauserella salsuginis TaxID=387889 RepID=A0ABW6GBQ9_9PSEU|nr:MULTISPECIES: hypothetical protein [Prauserella salsuginis group]MCR3721886.1 hypothetical protein [Prauserella flava]MCR3735891.1 hypothetical protein [Prauserella salsuginis]
MTEPDERPEPDPLAPYPTLAERDAGTPPEPELYEGVPPHMQKHLSDWVGRFLQDIEGLAERVTARMRMHWTARVTPLSGGARLLTSREAIMRVVNGRTDGIDSHRPLEPLTAVDAAIKLHPYWDTDDEYDLVEWEGELE